MFPFYKFIKQLSSVKAACRDKIMKILLVCQNFILCTGGKISHKNNCKIAHSVIPHTTLHCDVWIDSCLYFRSRQRIFHFFFRMRLTLPTDTATVLFHIIDHCPGVLSLQRKIMHLGDRLWGYIHP